MARIVVCEDDPNIRTLIRVALRSTPHRVFLAADGLEGLALIERERPDLVLTDVSMPGLSGLELADAMRARVHLARIPVVLISASVQRIDLEEGYRHGAAGYLTTPFSTADLRARIDEFLGEHRPDS